MTKRTRNPKKILTGAAWGAVGGGLFLGLDDLTGNVASNFVSDSMKTMWDWASGWVEQYVLDVSGGDANTSNQSEQSPRSAITTSEPPGIPADHAQQAPETAGMTHQQIKDEAFRLFNDGNAANDLSALALFQQAADMGNTQAKVDLAFIQYHGLAGVHSDPQAAIATMRDLAAVDHRAAAFVSAWTGEGHQAAITSGEENMPLNPRAQIVCNNTVVATIPANPTLEQAGKVLVTNHTLVVGCRARVPT